MAEPALAQTPAPADKTVLSVKGLQAWYNRSHILHGVDLDVREGEVVNSAWTKRSWQDDHTEGDHGHRPQASRFRRVRRQGASSVSPSTASPGAASRFVPRNGPYSPLSRSRKESVPAASDRENRRDERGAHLRALSQFARAAGKRRRQAVRRRATDARHRADLANRRAISDARRTDRGPRAGHHPADRPHHR